MLQRCISVLHILKLSLVCRIFPTILFFFNPLIFLIPNCQVRTMNLTVKKTLRVFSCYSHISDHAYRTLIIFCSKTSQTIQCYITLRNHHISCLMESWRIQIPDCSFKILRIHFFLAKLWVILEENSHGNRVQFWKKKIINCLPHLKFLGILTQFTI